MSVPRLLLLTLQAQGPISLERNQGSKSPAAHRPWGGLAVASSLLAHLRPSRSPSPWVGIRQSLQRGDIKTQRARVPSAQARQGHRQLVGTGSGKVEVGGGGGGCGGSDGLRVGEPGGSREGCRAGSPKGAGQWGQGLEASGPVLYGSVHLEGRARLLRGPQPPVSWRGRHSWGKPKCRQGHLKNHMAWECCGGSEVGRCRGAPPWSQKCDF